MPSRLSEAICNIGEEMTLTLFYRSGLCADFNVNRL
nr:MAG TPA: HTH-type transcriptional regulator [Caudoviricetes sp.]